MPTWQALIHPEVAVSLLSTDDRLRRLDVRIGQTPAAVATDRGHEDPDVSFW